MRHPAAPLHKSVIDALKAHEGVVAIVGNRIYDHIPDDAKFPLVALEGIATTRALWEHDCYVSIACMTKARGRISARRLAAEVVDALDHRLVVEGFDTDQGGFVDDDDSYDVAETITIIDATFNYVLSAEEDLFED